MRSKGHVAQKSKLQRALARGTKPRADLWEEVQKLGEYTIRSRADANAICDVLNRIIPSESAVGGSAAFNALIFLCDQVDAESPAGAVLAKRGVGLLEQIVDDALRNPSRREGSDVLWALSILAKSPSRKGTDLVIRAARQSLMSDDGTWSAILDAYATANSNRGRLFRELSDPFPHGRVAVALAEACNVAKRNGANFPHSFDTEAGKQQLKRWLKDKVEDNHECAIIAVMSLYFIHGPERERLLNLAFKHPSEEVRIQGARIAAELGIDGGIERLARLCLDVNLSERARQNLVEIGRADAIPAKANEAAFRVRTRFADWLMHPFELGRSPVSVEIADHRELIWPPDRKPIQQWLVRYRANYYDGTPIERPGIGIVGSCTCCLVDHVIDERPYEDCYSIYCYAEMINKDLIKEIEVPEESTKFESLRRQCRESGVSRSRILTIARFSPALMYPQKSVALARGKRGGERGWFVLDGPRSRWYAVSEMPNDTWDDVVLAIHVGRVLLGFGDEPDRRKYHKFLGPQSKRK